MRVLLIRKEFKLFVCNWNKCRCLRVLLIRKEFKLIVPDICNQTQFESLVNTEGIQTNNIGLYCDDCLRVLLIRKEGIQTTY